MRIASTLFGTYLGLLVAVSTAAGQAPDWDPVVVAARGLAAGRESSWYDPDRDAIRDLSSLSPWEANESRLRHRQSDWASTPAALVPPQPARRAGWHAIGLWVGWTALAGILLLTSGAVVWALLSGDRVPESVESPARRSKTAGAVPAGEPLTEVERAVELDLLAKARQRQSAGEGGSAIVYLFYHQLLRLDQAAIIRYGKGKTNGQYLDESARYPPVHDTLAHTMRLFEEFFFGGRQPSGDQVQACFDRLSEVESFLERQPP